MAEKPETANTSEIVSDRRKLSLEEVCAACGISKDHLTEYVQEGVIETQTSGHVHWRFSELTVIRLRKARRLERDLRLNPPGVALALEMMQRIEELEARLARYRRIEQVQRDED